MQFLPQPISSDGVSLHKKIMRQFIEPNRDFDKAVKKYCKLTAQIRKIEDKLVKIDADCMEMHNQMYDNSLKGDDGNRANVWISMKIEGVLSHRSNLIETQKALIALKRQLESEIPKLADVPPCNRLIS